MDTPASAATLRRLAASSPIWAIRRRPAPPMCRRRSSWSTCLGTGCLLFVMRPHCETFRARLSCECMIKERSGPMETAFARNGETEIAYETFGAPDGVPLMLLSGLDYQMVWWPEALCTALAERGFRVVRCDYRDSGLSTHFTRPMSGGPWRALLAGARRPPYRGQDMVQDILAVQDALSWDSAHLLGLSMGAGMAQLTALLHPGRVRTLTLVSGIPVGGNPVRMLP